MTISPRIRGTRFKACRASIVLTDIVFCCKRRRREKALLLVSEGGEKVLLVRKKGDTERDPELKCPPK